MQRRRRARKPLDSTSRRPSVKDVATRSGVSRALVSMVYRDAATGSRVRPNGAEAEHRAQSNGAAHGRRLGVVYGVRQAFHGDILESLYAIAEPAGYDVTLSAVTPRRDENHAVQALLDDGCDALILLGTGQRSAQLAELGQRTPTVVVARKVRAEGIDVVRTDDTDGMRQAVEHLIALGHRRIVHLDGGREPGAAERRIGYRMAIKRARLEELIVAGGVTEEDGADAAEEVFRVAPTAAAVFNDRMAVGLLARARRLGHTVPGELSIVGYDDSSLARYAHIDLTTVGQNPSRLAELAVTRAMARVNGIAVPSGELVLRPTLTVRGSTARP